MIQLPLFLPFTEVQKDAMLTAVSDQTWQRPDSWCYCDTCRRSRQAEAIRNGTMSEAERDALAKQIWNLPGIYQKPGPYIDYDCHEELHRAVWGIRWGQETAVSEETKS